MKPLYTIVAVLVAGALICSIGAITLQQQASADHPVGGAKTFKEDTHDFEKNVINALNSGASPTDMRELLGEYIANLQNYLPDPVFALIQNYERDVITIFDQSPPEPDKQIKDFRATTHDFVKAVLAELNSGA
jgi:hypothetical protein